MQVEVPDGVPDEGAEGAAEAPGCRIETLQWCGSVQPRKVGRSACRGVCRVISLQCLQRCVQRCVCPELAAFCRVASL